MVFVWNNPGQQDGQSKGGLTVTEKRNEKDRNKVRGPLNLWWAPSVTSIVFCRRMHYQRVRFRGNVPSQKPMI